MSHFTPIKCKYTNLKHLLTALGKLGFEPQVHDIPEHLYGYRGDKRKQKANVIVPRKQIGSASNDLGFLWEGDSYTMIISDYDRGGIRGAKRGQGLGSTFQSVLSTQYALAALGSDMPEGYKIVDQIMDVNGDVQLIVEVEEQNEFEAIAI